MTTMTRIACPANVWTPVYTAAAGTKIGTISHPLTLLQSQYGLKYDAAFANGLTIVTSAADDITVIYR